MIDTKYFLKAGVFGTFEIEKLLQKGNLNLNQVVTNILFDNGYIVTKGCCNISKDIANGSILAWNSDLERFVLTSPNLAGTVDSIFGRQNDVVAQDGDYTASQVNFVAVPGILSTNVQSAIIELQGQINGVGLGVATETNSGSVRLATQVEVDNVLDNTTAVTPLKLGQYISNLGLSKSFLLQNVDIIGGTPYVVSFPTPASNLHAYYVSIKDSIGNTISLDVDSVDINSFTVSAISDLTNLTIFVTYI